MGDVRHFADVISGRHLCSFVVRRTFVNDELTVLLNCIGVTFVKFGCQLVDGLEENVESDVLALVAAKFLERDVAVGGSAGFFYIRPAAMT